MRGEFEEAAKFFSSWSDRSAASNDAREAAYWSLIGWAYTLVQKTQSMSVEEASELFPTIEEKLEAALAIKPDDHEVLTN